MRKGQAYRNLRMSVLEVLDEVTSILSGKRLAFQDNLDDREGSNTRGVDG